MLFKGGARYGVYKEQRGTPYRAEGLPPICRVSRDPGGGTSLPNRSPSIRATHQLQTAKARYLRVELRIPAARLVSVDTISLFFACEAELALFAVSCDRRSRQAPIFDKILSFLD